ncbi:MAG: MurT ligase domain-containing protein [Actinomycetes bacterium]
MEPRQSTLGAARAVPLRTRLAAAGARNGARLSRALGRGDGSTVGGVVARRIDPAALSHLAAHARTALVTGTNGKTTTTQLLAAALGTLGPVATNRLGSNMAEGLVTAFAERPTATLAALEVDESYLLLLADDLQPEVVVVLNLSSECTRGTMTSTVLEQWRAGLPHLDAACTVVANADDPLVAYALERRAGVVWVAGGGPWTQDSTQCPACHATMARTGHDWWCTGCDLSRPSAEWSLSQGAAVGTRGRVPLHLDLPGWWSRSNALFALAAADVLGVDLSAGAAALAGVADVGGRYRRFDLGSHTVRLVMVKNAASWTSACSVGGPEDTVVLAAEPFGVKDMAPLWDADLSDLRGRHVVAAGHRRADIALRLEMEGIAHSVISAPLDAVPAQAGGTVYVVANYTSFLDARQALA